MKRSGTLVGIVLGVLTVLVAWPPAEAGVRAPSAEGGRRPLATRIASGGDVEFGTASCAVNGDGTVRCWGRRGAITRELGSSVPFSAPIAIEGVTDAVAVAVGTEHACALRSSGTVACWGSNNAGQLGLGVVTSLRTFDPTTVPNLAGVANIAAGGRSTCVVLVDGTARCWGANNSGQLGNQTTSAAVPSPVLVTQPGGAPLSGLVGLAISGGHACALTAAGHVACWGNNNNGQVDGSPTLNVPRLAATDPGLSNVVDVSTGPNYTCAVLVGGTARCWGSNNRAQLGAGTTSEVLNGVNQVSGLTGAVSIAAAFGHACAVLATGSVSCWGALGDGAVTGVPVFNTLQPSPVPVPNATRTVAIAAGPSISCAHLVDDDLRCWGDLEIEDVFNARIGSAAPISGRGVAAGGRHSCARRAEGRVACWGENGLAQLGTLSPRDQLAPVTAALGTARASAVAAGDNHSCARVGDGTARCWGDNGAGQAGDLTGGVEATPITVIDRFVFDPATFSFVPAALSSVMAVANGRSHSCAVLGGGAVACWGSNASGQLGDGTTNQPSFPTPAVRASLPQPATAIAVAAGNGHSCALRADASVRCWGSNTFGQVTGAPTVAPQPTPVAPALTPALSGVVAISAGDFHTCALQVNGQVRCWGSNGSGRLGDGSVTDVTAVSAGGLHTCVVRANGTAQCWGGNGSGQLGNGTFVSSSAPVTVKQVAGLRTICCPLTVVPVLADVTGLAAIEVGNTHSCAVRVDGQPLCWGGNTSGQVGDGSTNNRSTAMAVPSFLFNVDPGVALTSRGRIAQLTALVNCPAGQQVQVRASITQGTASGQGIAVGACTGGIARYEVTVPAQGREGFVAGPALAEADAIVREHGQVTDTQEWAREVAITVAP